MDTPTDLGIWLREQAWPLLVIAGLVVATYVALKITASRRRKALTEERYGITADSFTAYLSQYNIDPVVSRSTYKYLQEVQLVDFPILPSDKLDEDLGLGHEDIEQTIRELSAALRRELNPGQERTAVVSVEDLVRLIQSFPAVARTKVA